jgi:DNA-binding FadR family transcriptional regulator
MTERPPFSASDTSAASNFDVTAAFEALFDEIVERSNNPLLKTSLDLMREETRLYRTYEDAFLPDRETEYLHMLDCWRRGDKPALQKALAEYFQRRDDLAAKVADLIDRPT